MTIALLPIAYIFRYPLFRVVSLIFKDNATVEQTGATVMMLLFALIYIVLIVFTYGNKDNRINGYMNIFLLACICMIFTSVHSTAMRIAYYFMIPLILLMPAVLKKIEKQDWKMIFAIKSIIVVGFVWFAFDCIVNTYWAMSYPYYAFWESIYS